MLFGQGVTFNAYESTSRGNLDTTYGVAVTPGTSGAEGTAATLITSTAFTSHLCRITVNLGAVTAVDKTLLLDIGYDAAGGSTYKWIIPDLNCAHEANNNRANRSWYFPVRIPSGMKVVARLQGGSTDTVATRVMLELWGKPTTPEHWRSAGKIESIGVVGASTRGTVVDTGIVVNGAAMGSTWVSLGTCANPLFYLTGSTGLNDASTNAQQAFFDVAAGPSTARTIIMRNLGLSDTSTGESITTVHQPFIFGYWPAGTEFWVRGSCSLATLDSNYNVILHGAVC